MTSEELNAAVADAVAQCEGDLPATVRMLLVAVDFWQGLSGRLADAVSPGFVRGDPAFTVPERGGNQSCPQSEEAQGDAGHPQFCAVSSKLLFAAPAAGTKKQVGSVHGECSGSRRRAQPR